MVSDGLRVSVDEGGSYHWTYNKSLYRDPLILILLLKIMVLASLVPAVLVFLLEVWGGGIADAFDAFLSVAGIVLVVVIPLSLLGYLIYAVKMGGHYRVVFTMDDRGILHEQEEEQADKARKAGALTAATGLVTGDLTTAGAGLNSMRTEMYTEFGSVRSLRLVRRYNTIFLDRNQVYVHKEDMDKVWGYILDRCPKAKVKGRRRSSALGSVLVNESVS